MSIAKDDEISDYLPSVTRMRIFYTLNPPSYVFIHHTAHYLRFNTQLCAMSDFKRVDCLCAGQYILPVCLVTRRVPFINPAVPSLNRSVRNGDVCLDRAAFPRADCSVDSECHYQRCLHTSAVVASQQRRRSTVCRLEEGGRGGIAGDGAELEHSTRCPCSKKKKKKRMQEVGGDATTCFPLSRTVCLFTINQTTLLLRDAYWDF